MKFLIVGLSVLGGGLLACSSVQAQSAPASTWQDLPPPAIDDPGAVPAAPASRFDVQGDEQVPLQQEAEADGDAPLVKVKKHDGKLIEQYYRGGQLYMVRVHPKYGVPYTYVVDKSGALNREPGAPPVNPVLYTVLEWGKPASSRDDER